MLLPVYESGFAPDGTTVLIEVDTWDYVLAVVYTVILLINICGIAKYAVRAHTLTLFIMISNFCAISYREVLFMYLFSKVGSEIRAEEGRAFFYFFFELPYHCFNVVAFLLLINWVQAWLILRQKRMGQESMTSATKLILERKRLLIFLSC